MWPLVAGSRDDPRQPPVTAAERRTFVSDRERARRLATLVVSVAIGALGVTLVVFALFLFVQGGFGFFFLALLVGLAGAALALLGFFFQLVPFRLQELADLKHERDLREE